MGITNTTCPILLSYPLCYVVFSLATASPQKSPSTNSHQYKKPLPKIYKASMYTYLGSKECSLIHHSYSEYKI